MPRRLLLTLTVAALIGGCAGPEPTPEETALTVVGQDAPQFRITTIDGHPFDLADQLGRVVVLNFFATWCPPCREEMPFLERDVWARFQGPGFAMLALSREETREVVAEFVAANALTFPVAVDADRNVYSRYADMYIPRTVVVAPDGTIAFQSSGFERAEFDRMIEVVESALASAAATTADRTAAATRSAE